MPSHLKPVWCGEGRAEEGRVFLRATLRNELGIAGEVLTAIADHGCDVVRLAGFQEGSAEKTSIFLVIFVLPGGTRLRDLDAALNTLPNLLATEYPVRRLTPDMRPEEG